MTHHSHSLSLTAAAEGPQDAARIPFDRRAACGEWQLAMILGAILVSSGR